MGPLNAWNLGGCFTCDGFLVDVFLWIYIYICVCVCQVRLCQVSQMGVGWNYLSIYLHMLVDIPGPVICSWSQPPPLPPNATEIQRYPEDFLAKTRGVDPDQQRW